MQRAAALIEGEHDFKAFCASGSSAKTSVRTVYSIRLTERGGVYEIRITGNGFLYNMVRIIAGELIAVGCGKEEAITAAFESGERKALAKTMPAKGLRLVEAEYGVKLFEAASEE
ncbi:MAG: tRNA pseudouridine(38-40) synthase TruA, partial [Clostridia bacterium]|nr:tRNA pseudouridine(38-40) synthase TruA [Clostridia bacterium]